MQIVWWSRRLHVTLLLQVIWHARYLSACRRTYRDNWYEMKTETKWRLKRNEDWNEMNVFKKSGKWYMYANNLIEAKWISSPDSPLVGFFIWFTCFLAYPCTCIWNTCTSYRNYIHFLRCLRVHVLQSFRPSSFLWPPDLWQRTSYPKTNVHWMRILLHSRPLQSETHLPSIWSAYSHSWRLIRAHFYSLSFRPQGPR